MSLAPTTVTGCISLGKSRDKDIQSLAPYSMVFSLAAGIVCLADTICLYGTAESSAMAAFCSVAGSR